MTAAALAPASLTMRYATFAAIATSLNLATQVALLRMPIPEMAGLPSVEPLWPALVAGSAVGLAVKYELDRRWIFADLRPLGAIRRSRQFALYALVGVATTALFWVTEILFLAIGGTLAWQLTGGALGLILGYWIKYRIDRVLVFRIASP